MYALMVVVQPAAVSVFQAEKDPWLAKDDTGTEDLKKPCCLLQIMSPHEKSEGLLLNLAFMAAKPGIGLRDVILIESQNNLGWNGHLKVI